MFKVLSHFISNNTPTYRNKNIPELEYNFDIPKNLQISLNNHTSTHIDFPAHFCKDGKTLNDYEDDFWHFDKVGFIESNLDDFVDKLDLLDKNIEILLLKTDFEEYRDTDKYIFEQPIFPKNLAKILRIKFKNLRVFGFDMISISSTKNRELGRVYHKEFLCENNILLLEDMKLSVLYKKPKFVIIAPLLIKNADAVPVFVYAKVKNG